LCFFFRRREEPIFFFLSSSSSSLPPHLSSSPGKPTNYSLKSYVWEKNAINFLLSNSPSLSLDFARFLNATTTATTHDDNNSNNNKSALALSFCLFFSFYTYLGCSTLFSLCFRVSDFFFVLVPAVRSFFCRIFLCIFNERRVCVTQPRR